MPPTLTSIDPADGSAAVIVGTPVVVRLQHAGSTNVDITEAAGNFGTGTLTDVRAAVAGLELLAAGVVEDFEDDTIGQVPAGWTVRGGTGITVEDLGAQNALKSVDASARAIEWTAVDAITDREIVMKVRRSGTNEFRVYLRWSGAWAQSGGTGNGYLALLDPAAPYLLLYKRVNGAFTLLGTDATIAFADATDYMLRFQVTGTTVRARWWAAAGAEPGTWNLSVTDAAVSTAGTVLFEDIKSGTTWYDDITLIGEGDTYTLDGNRISPEYTLTAVGEAGAATIEFDATVPTGTTLAVTTRIDGGAWSTSYTSGDAIAGITDGDDLTGKVIEVRAELATTDDALTPRVQEIRLRFSPIAAELLEVEVAGIAFTTAAGTMSYWNDSRIVGGELVLDESDLYFSTEAPWYALEGVGVTVTVTYDGTLLDTITFTVEDGGEWDADVDGYWVAWESTPHWRQGEADGYYCVLDHASSLIMADGYWVAAEQLSVVADGFYWCAHAFESDGPGAIVVGQPTISDGPGAIVARCWTRDDGPGAIVVQGWLRCDGPGAIIPAQDIVSDAPAAAIVAQPVICDGPVAVVAYEAPTLLALDIQVLDPATVAALAAAGVLVPS